MLTRSGKRSVANSRSRAGQARERRRDDTHRRERAAERVAARRGPASAASTTPVLRVARRRVGRERDVRVRRRDHEVDLLERVAAIAAYACEAQLLGDRGGLQVVERLRHVEADRDLVGEVAARTAATDRRARRATSTGCPSSTARRGSGARGRRRPRPCPVASMSSLPRLADTRLDLGRDVDDATERRAAPRRGSPARSCVPSPASHPPVDGQARRIGGVVARAHVVERAPRRARSGPGSRARRCSAARTRAAHAGCGRRCPSSRAGRCSRPGCGSNRRRRRRSRA